MRLKIEYDYIVPTQLPEIQLYSATILRAIEDIRIGCRISSGVVRNVEQFHINFSDVRSAIVYIFAKDKDKLILKHLDFLYGDNCNVAHYKLIGKVIPWLESDAFLSKRFSNLL